MLLVVWCSLAAAAPPLSLAMPGLNGVGLVEGEAQLYSELLAQKLHELGFKVITARDMGATLGLERQKQLLGCQDTGCIAELAGALGTDGLVLGDVGKLDQTYSVTFKVVARDATTLAIFNTTAPKSELPAVISTGARALAHQLAEALHRPELASAPPEVGRSAGGVRLVSAVPFAVGALALLGGVACELVASAKLNGISTAESLALAALYRSQGKQWEIAGHALLAIGVTGALAGAVLFLLGGSSSSPAPAVALVPGGAALSLTGVWP